LIFLLLSFVVGTAMAERVVVTSGRVVYDAFGRVIATYHPTVDGDTVTAFSCEVDTVPPTVTAYDVLDRPVRVTYPDNSVTETDYGVFGHVQVTMVTDALGNVSKAHVDGSKAHGQEYIKRTVPFFFQ
jgi:L-aminopeptidase/D-esterase-like protein